jgi:hypothetical protein
LFLFLPFYLPVEISSVGVWHKEKKTILSREGDPERGGKGQNVRGKTRQGEKVLAHSGWIGY